MMLTSETRGGGGGDPSPPKLFLELIDSSLSNNRKPFIPLSFSPRHPLPSKASFREDLSRIVYSLYHHCSWYIIYRTLSE